MKKIEQFLIYISLKRVIRYIIKRSINLETFIHNRLITWYNLKRGLFAVEIRSDHGFGAKLEWVLEILAYCDEKDLIPSFKFSYPDSEKHEDYFGSYFSIKGNNKKFRSVRFTRIKNIGELGLEKNYDTIMNLKLATNLINKYLDTKEDVISEVDDFCYKHFCNRRILGVHYRGTDKVDEAPLVDYDRVIRNIEYYIEKFPEIGGIFISSDNINFIEYIEKVSLSRTIIYRNDSFRSRDDKPIHKVPCINRYDMNRDALINCLILSRCNALIKGASILSGWSKLFNPQLSLIMLNTPYNLWFPERELIKEVIYDAI